MDEQPLDGPDVEVSDPHDLLAGYLDWYREALVRKLDGLSDAALRTPVPPMSWAPLGMVKHLTWVERRWLCWGFLAQDVVAWHPDGELAEYTIADSETADEIFTTYAAQIGLSRDIINSAALTDQAAVGGRFRTAEQAPSLSRILFHLLQEYARHLGHVDIARELIDGTTGE
jgi:uncharacterized damage-inducible protein DinB